MQKKLLVFSFLLITLLSCSKDEQPEKYPYSGRVLSRFDGCSAVNDTAGTAIYFVISQRNDLKADTLKVLNLPASIKVGDLIRFNYRSATPAETSTILCLALFLPPNDVKAFTDIMVDGD
jgi:hypothetical protein